MALITDPITIGTHTVPNRVVLPPIVVFLAGGDGYVTDFHVSHYRRRALGGCGTMIVEATCVLPEGRLRATQLGIWDDAHISGLTKVADACKTEGALALIQIHHAGLKSSHEVTDQPLSASDYRSDENSARRMTVDEIETVIDAFVAAAVRAEAAGFDGVELHGAHGFLLSQFASPMVNKRDDEYGGSLEGRLLLARKIIEGIRSAVSSKDFIVACRMGCNEPELSDGIEIAKALESYGLDLLHVSSGFGGAPEPVPPESFYGSWRAWGASEIRKHVGLPVIGVQGIRTHRQASWLLDGHLDMVALARGLLVDPDWPKKAVDGREIVTCVECKPRCKWFEDPRSCPRYDTDWETA